MLGKLLDGRYRIVNTLSSGGFGQTYVAEDTRRPGNPKCLLKHLKPARTDPEFLPIARRLFNSEAETLEKLGHHDRIPRLLAYFEENQEFYLVQEFIEGNPLSTELPPGLQWTEAQVIQLLVEVLNTLEFVHSQGVIHRDIKPDNLLRRHSDNKLVLIDFGAVKHISQLPANSQEQSNATIAIGTSGYLPTEQSQGKPRFNSDIYALGIIGLQALTGLAPHDLEEDCHTGEIVWQHLVSVSPRLVKVLTKMVRYHFKDRYQSSTDVLQALSWTYKESQNKEVVSLIFERRASNEAAQSISGDQAAQSISGNQLSTYEPQVVDIGFKKTVSGKLLILREQARQFHIKFAKSLEHEANQPAVFHVHGIGGVGKTTLLQELQEENVQKAHFVWLSFDLALGVETPLRLMAKLYEEVESVTKPSFWQQEVWPSRDPFTSLYKKYQQVLCELETQPVEGKGQVSPEQLTIVKQLVKLGFGAVGQITPTSGITAPALEKFAEASVDAATLFLSEKDRWQKLLQQHQATRKKKELQELILEPLIKLTQAFAEGLIFKAKRHPIVLVLDTYEKAAPDINIWLWQYLLANTKLRQYKIRLVIAGRYSLLKTEGWRRLHQSWQLLYEVNLNRFDEKQTKIYLTQLDIRQNNQIQAVYRTTKGLPYYLNWLREQKEQGIEIDFSQGNDEIAKVLLQGFNINQKRVLQLAACCRWFDRSLLQNLIKNQDQDLQFETAVDEKLDCFEWLIQRDFVKVVRYRHCLDDVARDIFRLSLWQESPDLFHRAHTILANYFEQKAEQRASPSRLISEQLGNPDWCTYTTEVLYHRFFSEPSEQQRQFLSNLSASSSLSQSEIMRSTFIAITSEADVLEHPLLPHEAKEFLTTIKVETAIAEATTLQESE